MQNSEKGQPPSQKQNLIKIWNLKGKLSGAFPRVVVRERRAQSGLGKGSPQDGVFCFRFLSVNAKLSKEKLQNKNFQEKNSKKKKPLKCKARKRETSKLRAKPCRNLESKRETFQHLPTRCGNGAEGPQWAQQNS